jgi:uncharacterized protein YqjF (DUF2071 family)
MPRYHFNVMDGTDVPDIVGTELTDLAEARREAVRLVGGLMRDTPLDFWREENWRMVVTDEAGLSLFSLHVLAFDAPAAASGPSPS